MHPSPKIKGPGGLDPASRGPQSEKPSHLSPKSTVPEAWILIPGTLKTRNHRICQQNQGPRSWILIPGTLKVRKTTKKVSRETSWDVPGRSRESPGDPRRLPGCRRRVPGSPLDLPTPALGPIWAPFRMPFWLLFSFEFRTAFF